MSVLSREVTDVTSLFRRAAASPSGLFSGVNLATYSSSDPFPLWVIQVVVIVGMTQLLAVLLGRIRQPRVIAEVIGGVLLGPSVMGRIPRFTETVFPNVSIPILTLTSDFGLILFLFLVGLEIDVRVMRRNARASIAISVAGLVIPLGLGAALAIPIYNVFIDHSVNFGYFVLFIAVAVGITAFPVLCRILTELKLVDTTVGVVVLAAGVGNDIVGWILLALTVALVNSSKGITALWILLAAVAYILFLTIPVRWGYRWLAKRTGSLETGQPTLFMMTLTMIVVLMSAFYTDIIGIHPIFGGFLAGLIIPHDNGFAIALVEKIEDLVSVLLLPIYFALSGLRTDLGLLNNGITWGYTVLICVVSFFSKFLGCAISAKFTGFNFREAGAIGSLMACKGLVELIALNIGLQAGILNTRVFSMFVLHALVTTFVTTPLVLLFYPDKYRIHSNTVQGVAGVIANAEGNTEDGQKDFLTQGMKTRFTVVLDRLEQLPAAMTLAQLLHSPSTDNLDPALLSSLKAGSDSTKSHDNLPLKATIWQPQISIDALRLIELTDRTSAVLKSQEADALILNDTMINVFRTFGRLNRMSVSTALSVVNLEDFPSHIANHAQQTNSQMVVVPWNSVLPSSSGVIEHNEETAGSITSPFDGLFPSKRDWASLATQSQFIRRIFTEARMDIALFIDRSAQEAINGRRHIFLPFFGGPDDRLALTFVGQLSMNNDITATVVRIVKAAQLEKVATYDTMEDAKTQRPDSTVPTLPYVTYPDTVYDAGNTQTRLQSETADDVLWGQYTSLTAEAGPLSRMSFLEQSAEHPLHAALEAANSVLSQGCRLFVVTGRSRRESANAHERELREVCAERGVTFSSDASKMMGDVAAAFLAQNVRGSLLVLQRSNQSA